MKSRPMLSALLLSGVLAACSPPAPTPAAPQEGLPDGFSEALIALSAQGGTSAGMRALALTCPTTLALPYGASGLDTGVYWYSKGEAAAPGGVGCKARSDGATIPGYYDPAKPVMVFVHGWQNGSTVAGVRDNFYFSDASRDVVDAWIDAGWNVALYQWTQLADDEGTASVPYHAQAKIWTPTYAYTDTLFRKQTIAMRYRTPGGTYSTANMPTVSAGQLFYTAYKSALNAWTYAGPEGVRVMGHSLGAQMALAMTEKAYADTGLSAAKRPKRVILADPYWSPASPSYGHSYSYVSPDANPAARSARIAQSLKAQGVAIEWFKSSRVNDLGGDNNTALSASVSRTEVFPEYVTDLNPATGLARKHSVAPRYYLWTQAFAARPSVGAANTLAGAQAVMTSGVRYDQNLGRSTTTPGDDTFVSAPNP